MKILGEGDGFICHVSWEEMNEILGGGMYDVDVSAGDEIDLQRVIRAAKWVRDLDGEHIERITKELQTTLVGVQKLKATAEALNLFNKLKETHEQDLG